MNTMIEKYRDADAIVTIEGKEYALYKKGHGRKKEYPYMIDIATGGIPDRKQRPLMNSYLLLNGISIGPLDTTHECIRQAITIAQRKIKGTIVQSEVSSAPAPTLSKDNSSIKKKYLPITTENIVNVHQQVLKSTSYGANFSMIHNVLKRFPLNTERELIAMKVSLIDLTNSTNIGRHINKISLSELVELISNIRDFDTRIAQGDPELVNQIARCNGKVNFFSFASKYCTYHNMDIYERDDYSIYDSVVQEALPYYIPKLTQATVNNWRKTLNYAAFSDCIGKLLDQNDIHIPFRRRKFDHFLWYSNRKK